MKIPELSLSSEQLSSDIKNYLKSYEFEEIKEIEDFLSQQGKPSHDKLEDEENAYLSCSNTENSYDKEN